MKEIFQSFPKILGQFKTNKFKILALTLLLSVVTIVPITTTKIKQSGCSGLEKANIELTNINNSLMNQNQKLTGLLTNIQGQLYNLKPDTIVGSYEQPKMIVSSIKREEVGATAGDSWGEGNAMKSVQEDSVMITPKPVWKCYMKRGNKEKIFKNIDSLVNDIKTVIPNSK